MVMRETTLERRLDLLKLEGNGLLRPEIVKELSVRFKVTKNTLWYDFRTKHKWQPFIQELKTVYLRIINRHDQLYRKASLEYMRGGTVKEKLVAVNLMRVLNRDFYEFVKGTGYKPEQLKPQEPRELKWVDPPEWRQKLCQSTTNPIEDKKSFTEAKHDSDFSRVADDGEKPLAVQTKQSGKHGSQAKTA